MASPSPACSVQDGGGAVQTVPPFTATAGNVITVALVSNSGVNVWTLVLSGQDELVVPPTVTNNPVTKTATFTAPTGPWALIYKSQVNGGVDVNGQQQPSFSTTLEIHCKTAGGLYLAASNESQEFSAQFGWTGKINQLLRSPSGTTTTGTGFWHNTAGGLDSAARAVNLASADVTGVLATTNGGTGLSTVGSNGQVLTIVSGVPAWANAGTVNVTGSGLWHNTSGALNAAAYIGTAGQVLFTNSGATDTSWASSSQDVTYSTSTIGQATVVGIRGNSVPAPSGTNTVLSWSGSAFSWAAGGGTGFTPGADLSGNGTSTSTLQYVSSLSFSSAAVGGSIAVNGTNTLLNWSTNAVTLQQSGNTVVSIGRVIGDYIAFGALPPTSGTIRLSHPFNVYSNAQAGGASAVVTWMRSVSDDSIQLGGAGAAGLNFTTYKPNTSSDRNIVLQLYADSTQPTKDFISMGGPDPGNANGTAHVSSIGFLRFPYPVTNYSIITERNSGDNGDLVLAQTSPNNVLFGSLSLGNTQIQAQSNVYLIGNGAVNVHFNDNSADALIATGHSNSQMSLQFATAVTLGAINFASTTAATGSNIQIAPQTSTATNGTPGSAIVLLAAPTGSGSHATFQVQDSGVTQFYVNNTNTQLVSQGNQSFGGGVGVVGITQVNTVPTAASTNGIVLYANTGSPGGLGLLAGSIAFNKLVSGISIIQDTPTTDVAAGFMLVQAQSALPAASTNRVGGNLILAAGPGATTNGTPGNVLLRVGLASGTGTEGTVQVQRNGVTGWQVQDTTPASGVWSMWLGSNAAPTTTNYALQSDSSGNLGTVMNTPTGGVLLFAINNAYLASQSINAFTFFGGGVDIAGGGTGVIGIAQCSTAPTGNPASGIVLYDTIGTYVGELKTRGRGGWTGSVAPPGNGSVNSQQGIHTKIVRFFRTTSNATVTLYTYNVGASSGNTDHLKMRLIGHDVTTVGGRTFDSEVNATLLNNAGTISVVGTTTVSNTGTAGTAAVGFGSPGTNIPITIATGSTDTIDFTLIIDAYTS